LDEAKLVSGSAEPGSGRRKLALVAARGEEVGGLGRPWQIRVGVGFAHGWGSGRRWLRHLTWLWLPVGNGLPVHSSGRVVDAAVEQRQSTGESRATEVRGRAKRGRETGRGLSTAHAQGDMAAERNGGQR
jgi:hypothetical protein